MSIFLKLSLFTVSVFMLMALPQFGYAHGMSEAEKQLIAEGGNLRYIWIGATHMLTGYDHLLFVFGIIFFLTKFRDIVKYITAFTLGHSVTLIFATFNAIQINYFLIDALIALSVCYIALVNLGSIKKYLHINPPNMLLMIIVFGLIHGLGLSTQLQQLPLSEDQLLMNIISFNIGIEIGQISALALMLVVISAFRKTQAFAAFSRITNVTLIFAGGALFLMQMHDYEHSKNPEEFVISQQASSSQIADTSAPTDWRHSTTITIPARGELEYKFQIENGKTLIYAWQTDGAELFFDFHGEPTGDTTGFFKSFKTGNNTKSNGSVTAPFTGPHGWYWKNNTASPVTIILQSKGDYQRLGLDRELDLFEVEAEIEAEMEAEEEVEVDLDNL